MRVVVGVAGRADLALAATVDGTSRKLLARAFADGKVRLNGRRARKGAPVVPGDVLEVEGVPDRAALAPVASEESPLVVVWQDASLLALDKAPGLPSMPLAGGEMGTLANALVARFPECVAAGEDPREAGLAHRLDVGTSGLILAARSREVWLALRAAFRAGQVAKEYLALVEGVVEGVHVVDFAIDHDPRGGVRRGGEATASTEVRMERRLGAHTLVRCLARSGRMHQVRAHLGWSGWPCVGDVRYGASSESDSESPGGPFLHAARLVFAHPVTGERMDLQAALPPARARVVAELAGC